MRDLNLEHEQLQLKSKKELSFFEFWPSWLFYLPIKIYAALLMLRYRSFLLPTVANPHLAGGAFCGDAKSQILTDIQTFLPEYSVPFILIDRQVLTDLDCISEAKKVIDICKKKSIDLPFVAKPEFGCRGAGVCLIQTVQDLERYLTNYPRHEQYIIQSLIHFQHEAGVFYCKLPRHQTGRIISLTLKFFPKVHGNGKSTLQQLIEADPRASQISTIYLERHKNRLLEVIQEGKEFPLVFAGNHSTGTIFKNGEQLITQTLEQTFEKVASRLPEFYFGRFDIRFSDFKNLEIGQNMKIVEINGASAESTHIWDSDYSLLRAYIDIFKQFNYLFAISAYNKKRGFKTQTWKTFYASYQRDKRLTEMYPGTD
jgi:hypothetical protein